MSHSSHSAVSEQHTPTQTLSLPAAGETDDRGAQFTVPLLRAELNFRARRAVQVPALLGDPLRSAFGWALKELVCVMRKQYDCRPCSLRGTCAYGALYEPPAAERSMHGSFTDGIPAYLFEPAGAEMDRHLYAGDALNCALTLLPGHRLNTALMAVAVRRAYTGNPRFLDEALALDKIQISEPRLPWPTDLPERNAPAVPRSEVLSLLFDTPLYVKHNSQHLRDASQLQSAQLSRLFWRRLQQIAQLAGLPLPNGRTLLQTFNRLQVDTSGLTWLRAERYSRSSQSRHPLGGFVGPLQLIGAARDLAAIRPTIELCQALHIGRHTVFGLGRYRISSH